ncbi:MAG: hypothetical protein ACXVDD_18015, partial [Polyangia bacterium]
MIDGRGAQTREPGLSRGTIVTQAQQSVTGAAGRRKPWMTMGSERFTIRPASPDEIDEAVDIDDDACTLFDTVGFQDDLGPQHPFKQAERARWLHAAREGSAFFAISRAGSAVGLLVLTFVDGQRYVEQLSVR